MNKKTAIIVGAGPAGLTAGYELLKQTDIYPIVIEASNEIGGISRTISHNGNRMDIGGHRFFSKNSQIMQWWQMIMPLQGLPALDDKLLQKSKSFTSLGPDPENENRVMLLRERVSRIFYSKRFFDYPITVKLRILNDLGIKNTLKIIFGYLHSIIKKRPEKSLEDFYINRFGKPLYKMFFEDYTEKVWGKHPSQLGADWGSQRVKGLSLRSILKDILTRPFKGHDIEQKQIETSLIEQFIYPKFGPGQLWEYVANDIEQRGGKIIKNARVVGINISNSCVKSVVINHNEHSEQIECHYLLSSMPIKELIPMLHGVKIAKDVLSVAQNLPYRDFISAGILVKKMTIENKTKIKTYNHRIPDTWIYIQEPNVKVGRIQLFNNWSPYMVHDYENTLFLGMEYFCTEGDSLWAMSESDFIKMAVDELELLGLVNKADVLDTVQIKVKKAYPAYYGSYHRLSIVRNFLNSIENLYCIGRNGQHRYNNMDHSMLTAFEAIKHIKNDHSNKDRIWNVNTESNYHEEK